MKKRQYIYTITCLYDIPPYCDNSIIHSERKNKNKEYWSHGGDRTVGWCKNLEDAKNIVESNQCDIHECSYKYVVIEKVSDGVYGFCIGNCEQWYEWNEIENKYMQIDKPEKLKHVVGFSIG